MSRPLRIQYAGALYHVTSRGNERKPIYREDADFQLFLDTLTEVCDRFNWVVHSFCLMTNHYHLEKPGSKNRGQKNRKTGVRKTGVRSFIVHIKFFGLLFNFH